MNNYKITYVNKHTGEVGEIVVQLDAYTSLASAYRPSGNHVDFSQVVVLSLEIVPHIKL